MVEQQQTAYTRMVEKALQTFEHPPVPVPYARPSNLYLITRSSMDNWDAIHIWFDAEACTAAATRIFWRRLFDSQRFANAYTNASSKHGQEEAPSLKITEYIPPYDELQRYMSAILGAIPAVTQAADSVHYDTRLTLLLRLPLGDVSLSWNGRHGVWLALLQRCYDLYDWILTTPRV